MTFLIDTEEGMEQLRAIIGGCSIGYGVRKKKPRLDSGPSVTNLHMNDGFHCIDVWNNKPSGQSAGKSGRLSPSRKRVEISYEISTRMLRVYVAYSYVKLADESVAWAYHLDKVGVQCDQYSKNRYEDVLKHIYQGAEFVLPLKEGEEIDDSDRSVPRYLYRVQSVEHEGSIIKAERKYEVLADGTLHHLRSTDGEEPLVEEFHDPSMVLRAINVWLFLNSEEEVE